MAEIREHWASKVGFILAAAGSAIGLGSLWKFPYMTAYNGGSAFVLLYLLFTCIFGIPLFVGELILGRRTQKGPIAAFRAQSKNSAFWTGISAIGVLLGFLIFTFYVVIAGWGCHYAFLAFTGKLGAISQTECAAQFTELTSNPWLATFWSLIFTALTAGIVYAGIQKGIERWSKLLTSALFVILLALFFNSMTLDGFKPALDFIFTPRFDKLNTLAVIEAIGMAFFTLSVGMGILVTYGSYLDKDCDLPASAFTVAGLNIVISLLAAMTIFPIVFESGSLTGAYKGPGLLFEVLPPQFANLPFPDVIASVFFSLVVFTALTSSISILELCVATLLDFVSWSRHQACFAITALVAVCSLPNSYDIGILTKLDHICTDILMPFCGFFFAIYMGWVIKTEVSKKEFELGSSLKGLFPTWQFMVRFCAPIGILVLVFYHQCTT